ncbi:MAG TPA: DUF4402 domain-containing protein [Ignavibacteria bacterium]|nr:DUF4402 domain-containing protein [Ignavibacteria bacterium]
MYENVYSVLKKYIANKFGICSIIVFFAFISSDVYSQPTQIFTQNSTGYATIIRGVAISLVGSNSLDFGDVVVTNSVQTVTITNENGQKFLATGEQGKSIFITYPSTVTLSNSAWVGVNGGTVSTLTFNSSTLKRTGTNSNYVSPVDVTSGSSVVLPSLSGIGTVYLWAGGSITVSANKPHGVYEGTYTISIAY